MHILKKFQLNSEEKKVLRRLLGDVTQSSEDCILACEALAEVLLRAGDAREALNIFVRAHCTDEDVAAMLAAAINAAAHDIYDLRMVVTEEAFIYIGGLKGKNIPIAEIVELLQKQQQTPTLRVVKK